MNMRNIVLDTNSLISKEKTLFLEKEDSYYENETRISETIERI